MDGGPARPSLAEDPGFLLSRVGTAVQGGFKEVLARWDMRPLHFLVLQTLLALPGPSQQALCSALRIDSGNMVELLDDLEGLGYAARARDTRDRRRHVVTATPAGRGALAEIMIAVTDFNQGFLGALDPAERQQLARLLAKLYATTAEGRGGGYAQAR